MSPQRLFPLALLASAVLLGGAGRAPAQIILGGGHVVIGGPVDFSTSTGQANYPGSDGFVPGYGYYPNGWRDSSWLAGRYPPPRAVYYRTEPPPVPPRPVLPVVPDGGALLVVRVPADAEVWFMDAPTTQRGELRLFVTPPLEKDRALTYDLRVRWPDGGKAVERSQTFRVRPGDRLLIDYLTTAARPDEEPTLPAPRKAETP